jgi:hypothetical protein
MSMTPEKAFRNKFYNQDMKLWAKDWFVVSSILSPPMQHEGEKYETVRVLAVMDAASGYQMHFKILPRTPRMITSNEIIELLQETFDTYKFPNKGIVISHGVWLSSSDLLKHPDIAQRSQILRKLGINFESMADDEKEKISDWVTSLNLRCEFDADKTD